MTLLALLAPVAAASACDEPSTNSALERSLDAAMGAYQQLDLASFRQHSGAALEQVTCLGEPITPPLAAAVHRVSGLIAFVDRDFELAEQSFAAARTVQPGYAFPTTIVPDDHPIQTHYTAIDLRGVGAVQLPAPSEGELYIDGTATQRQREGLPTVFQRLDRRGVVVHSGVLLPGAALPAYPVRPSGPQPRPLTFAAAGAAGVAIGAAALGYGLRSGLKRRVQDSGDPACCDGRVRAVNALGITAIGAGVGAAGLGVGAIVRGEI